MEGIMVHKAPAWRDRADFILRMKIDSEDGVARFEEIWAERVSDVTFSVCCIPFFIYDLALGDVVQASSVEGRQLMETIQPSGHHTFRVWFGGDDVPAEEVVALAVARTKKQRMESEVLKLGGLFEWHGANLMSISIPADDEAKTLVDYLSAEEGQGRLLYETGRTEASLAEAA